MTDDADSLWALLAASLEVSDEPERQAEVLRQRLVKLDKGSIQRFDRGFWTMMHRAYTWELWGVANLVNGHDGQEGFLAFRSWLLSRGRVVFDAALEDADSLAPHIAKARGRGELLLSGEALCQVARGAYEQAHGSELPTPTLDLFAEPVGEPIVASELTTRFPQVAAVVG